MYVYYFANIASMIFVSLGLAVLLGASLTGAILSYFFQCQWMEFTWRILGNFNGL